jgi:glycerate 2-kinase
MLTRLLQTRSLREHPLGPKIARALDAALSAVDPHTLVRQAVQPSPTGLRIRDRMVSLPRSGRILVIGAGKAGRAMAEALLDTLPDSIVEGVVAVKASSDEEEHAVGPIRIMPAGHPVPDGRSIAAGRALLELAGRAGPDDLVLCPISGGASALVTVPQADLSLDDLATVTRALLHGGADIETLNCVRKHLDAIKGGGLALAAAPARVVDLILSDVIGDSLDVIASGPTVGDASTFEDAWTAVHQSMEPDEIPRAVMRWLSEGRAGLHPETPAPDDPRLAAVRHVLLAGNDTAVDALAASATALGMAVLGRHVLLGEATLAGAALAKRVCELRSDGPACIVAGGETTVTVRGDGVGGRNLEVALAAVEELARVPGAIVVTFATDGDDGPSGAAGAVVTSDTLARACALGLDVQAHLARNDSLAFFDALGDTIRTGPTGTNVCDLAIGSVC